MWKYLGILLINGLAVFAQAQHKQHTDKPSTHGMVIFGTETFYLSHLPLFGSPHDYQVVLQIKLDNKTVELFQADQKAHIANTTYTIEPEHFVLPEMVAHPKSFKANLYRGHFERGGELISKDVVVNIEKVIYFRKFNPGETKAQTTSYLFVGNEKEQFIIHIISNKPDFDHIIQVKGDIKEGKIITLPINGNEVPGVSGNEIQVMDGVNKYKIVLLRQLYLEFDDLR